MKIGIWVFLLLGIPGGMVAQGVHPYEHHTERKSDSLEAHSFQEFFRRGTVFGHGRYMYMHTNNAPGLRDSYANAVGMGIAYESAPFRGLQVGLSGFFIYNIHSSDLASPDPITGQSNRYEVGLFDIERPNFHHDMDRLEDLYVKYSYRKSQLVFGKQHIRSPFINPQDGRMRPTLVEGLLFQLNEWEKLRIEGGWLFGISPRSTVSWYTMGESIGIYPAGVDEAGRRSAYPHQTNSHHAAFLTLNYRPAKQWELMSSQLWVENIFMNQLLELHWGFKMGEVPLRLSAQGIGQWAVGFGGNPDPSKAYLATDHAAYTYGFRARTGKAERLQMSLSYNRITDNDRYLMPREWGRDPFFTFLPRERSEGFSNVHAWVLSARKEFRTGLITSVGFGKVDLPEPDDFKRNKYGLPAYYQMNLDLHYTFGGWLQGFTTQLLYVHKWQQNQRVYPAGYRLNKVDMGLMNVVLNYHF
jgi:hypothetical protein